MGSFFQFTHYDDAKPKYHRNQEKCTGGYGLRHYKNNNIRGTLPFLYLPHTSNSEDFKPRQSVNNSHNSAFSAKKFPCFQENDPASPLQ
ncbi:hypothetical protein [Bartonella sp. OT172YNZD]|uniref:hypothetical protein n=1 Tax=Bartonella sp. OT172YNZD TaxID=3243572 RepID=UPI0035CF6954